MRPVPASILVSIVVHGGALAWAIRDGDARSRPVTVEASAPAADEAAVLSIELLDDETIAATRALPSSSLAPRSHASASAASAPATTRTGSEPGASPSTTAGSRDGRSRSKLAMRKPEVQGLSEEFLDEFLRSSKPLPPIPDLPGARIDAEIDDLRARIRNARGRNVDAERIRLVALHEERAKVELQPDGGGRYKANKGTFIAKIDPDGKAHLRDKPNVHLDGPVIRFDVTDALMRWQGIDPYAAEKLRFLDRTRDQRYEIGKQHRTEQLGRSGAHMQRNIDRLWAMTTDLAERKQGLFELWDDCAETGSDELVAGGHAAREMVVTFIRLNLRDEAAFSHEELAKLNSRRRSAAVFAPYD